MNTEKETLENKRVLIVNVNWLGDVLFSTAAIRLIKEKYPSCFLACMVVPRCGEILKNNPFVDELLFFDEKTLNASLLSKLKFMHFLRTKKFDTVFIFHRSFTRALICRLAGIPERIGYGRRKTGFLLTEKIEAKSNVHIAPQKARCINQWKNGEIFPKDGLDATAVKPWSGVHRVDSFLNFLKAKGLQTECREYQFFIKEEDRQFAARFLKENGVEDKDSVICLNPGGNWDLKRWAPENFVILGDLIAEKYKAKILLTGAEKDKELVCDIARRMTHKPIISAGKTSLSQLAALFEKSNLVISADSGPMHIAVSMKAPTIALFGPTSTEITGPIGSSKIKIIQENVGCSIPCYKLNCPSNKCMQAITPQKVMDMIEREKFIN